MIINRNFEVCLLVELIGDEVLGAHDVDAGAFETLIINALSISLVFALLLFSKRRQNSFLREVILITILASMTASLRIIFSSIPNLQPVTILLLIFGAHLGARRGSAIAILVALLSNIQLGTGTWTVFQATGWILVANFGHYLRLWLFDEQSKLNIGKLASIGFILGFIFDWWVSLSALQSLNGVEEFIAYILRGIPFDLIHGFGNVVFALWLARPTINLLNKYVETEETKIQKNESNLPSTAMG